MVPAAAVLLDLDGTLIDTTAAVEAAWRAAATDLGVPWARFAPYIHGIPADQVLAEAVPELSRADRDKVAEDVLAREADPALPVTALPGAVEVINALAGSRWAIVTSAGRRLARVNLAKARLPEPTLLITADDVDAGKPDPEPYLRAAQELGVAAGSCLAVEDAPAGISSARTAGCAVIAVTTTYPLDSLTEADWVVSSLAALTINSADGSIVVTVT